MGSFIAPEWSTDQLRFQVYRSGFTIDLYA